MTPAQADSQYLHFVKALELYGVDMHTVVVCLPSSFPLLYSSFILISTIALAFHKLMYYFTVLFYEFPIFTTLIPLLIATLFDFYF